MMPHERGEDVRVVPRYDVDTLGAPFKVTLLGGVTFGVDKQTGEETVLIPDLAGLISAVIQRRVRHTRKLSGKEIKFIRNALGVKAKLLADFLGVSAEHLSRCEAGAKAMSEASEKLFRFFAFLATFVEDPEDILTRNTENVAMKPRAQKDQDLQNKFVQMFLTMKIVSVFSPTDELHFEFVRRCADKGDDEPCSEHDEGEWSDEPIAA
jgi:transcriptional regulator with XRE-family HTH domain